MIDPVLKDRGREVVYQAPQPGSPEEIGSIHSFNTHHVFVLFDTVAYNPDAPEQTIVPRLVACPRELLRWLE